MRKSDFLSLLVYVIMFVMALFIGIVVIQPALSALDYVDNIQRYGFSIIVILVGIIFNVLLFETGHILGAIAGGYTVVSANIFGAALYKTKNGWKFGFKVYEGLTGETKIVAKKEKTSPRLFLFGPTLLVLLEGVLAIILFLSLPDESIIKHSSLIIAGIGAMLLVYNIMPFKLDNFTDGYYMVLLGKKVNKDAYNELIRIESLIYNNEEIGEIASFDEVTTMTARLSLYTLYQYIDEKKWKEANVLIDKLSKHEDKVELEFIARIKAQKLYITLLTSSPEEAEQYWFKSLTAADRKFISNDLNIETMRAYLLYCGLLTKSVSECAFVLNRAQKALKYRVNDYRKAQEIALFNAAFALVNAREGFEKLELPHLE